MDMKEIPRRVKYNLRQYSMQAYENELMTKLEKLAPKFKDWETGKMNSGELSEVIYRWANGPCKKLFKKYNDGLPEMNVAYAIVQGILDKSNIDAETLECLRNAIAFYEQNR
jgi:hypothetical protein